jgi:hypothetical protein
VTLRLGEMQKLSGDKVRRGVVVTVVQVAWIAVWLVINHVYRFYSNSFAVSTAYLIVLYGGVIAISAIGRLAKSRSKSKQS